VGIRKFHSDSIAKEALEILVSKGDFVTLDVNCRIEFDANVTDIGD
jgi:hypothetical protein